MFNSNLQKRTPNVVEARKNFQENEMAVRRVLGSDFSKLTADKSHPADHHRDRKALVAYAGNILDVAQREKRALTAEEDGAYTGIMALIDVVDIQLYLAEVNAQHNNGNKNNGVIFAKGEKIAREYRSQKYEGIGIGTMLRAMALGPNGDAGIQNALSEGTNSAGGYTVPQEWLGEFFDKLRDRSVLMQAGARTVLLESNKTSMAAVVTDPTPGWRAENSAVNESDVVFGQVLFQPKSLAVLVKVSRELLADSLNIEEILVTTLAGALGAAVDVGGLYGSGASNQPLGLKSVLTTNSRFGAIAANGGKISNNGKWTALTRSLQKVAAANDTPKSAIMNSRTLYDLHGLQDSTGQPLRAPSIIENDLMMYDTNSVPINQSEGTSGSVCSEIIVGNFENMLFGVRQQLEIELVREVFSDHLQVGFLAHLRCDWQVARPNSFWSTTGILAE